jgi:hypothetical protein
VNKQKNGGKAKRAKITPKKYRLLIQRYSLGESEILLQPP